MLWRDWILCSGGEHCLEGKLPFACPALTHVTKIQLNLPVVFAGKDARGPFPFCNLGQYTRNDVNCSNSNSDRDAIPWFLKFGNRFLDAGKNVRTPLSGQQQNGANVVGFLKK